jgi:dTDP-3-amino-3,4,6-trideoxy-alpha-D-glucose transaminase
VIPLNDFKRQWADTRGDVLAALTSVGESGWYVLGGEVRQFEEALAALWGLEHCVGVASGLDAIEIALRAAGCGAGDNVLTTPVSAFATTLAILKLGAIPVFADVDDAGQIDLGGCEALLEGRSDIRFLVPVHLYGQPLDPAALAALRDRRGLKIVEDCAQSILARRGGRATGTAGIAAATSFYPTKNLGALGDGGAILTNDPALAEALRQLRDYGQAAKYEHERIGYNSRLDEMHAAVLRRASLPRLPDWTARRREIAARYRREIRHADVRVSAVPDGADPCWHLFPVRVPAAGRTSFESWLTERQVATGRHYPTAIPDQPAMRTALFEAPIGIERAREFCASEVSLPIHPYLLDDEVGRVVEAVNAWEG